MPIINIYIGAVEDFADTDQLPEYAIKSLDKNKNNRSVTEKKAGYGLLHYATRHMNIDADTKECFLSKTGKPLHNDFCFSVSHKSGLAAVAVSSEPLGIDVELCDNEKRTDRLKQKIFHKNETFGNTLAIWTLKEAAFKFSEKDEFFTPSSIDTSKLNSKTVKFTWHCKKFILSVVADNLSQINFYNASDAAILPVENFN